MPKRDTASSKLLLLYPLAAGVLPALLLMLANVTEADWPSLWAPVGLSALGAVGLYVGFWLLFRDLHRAALVATCWLLLVFTYGHIVDVLVSFDFDEKTLHRIGRNVFILLAIVIATRVWWKRPHVAWFTGSAGLVIVLLCGLTVGQLLWAEWQTPASVVPAGEIGRNTSNEPREKPDIYYVILDGYARNDLLLELHKFDNSAFTDALKSRGFYVADQSYSNYPMTFLSLASSLNLTYLNELFPDRKMMARQPALDMIHKHKVGRYLKQQGYRTVHFCTGYNGTSRSDIADVQISPPGQMSEFQRMFLKTTLLWPLLGFHKAGDWSSPTAQGHLYFFSQLAAVADDPQPTFSLFHIVAPHPPYVFDRRGNVRQPTGKEGWKRRDLYIEQMQFVNRKTLEAIDAIRARSETPPVIIIQADHGPASSTQDGDVGPTTKTAVRERLAILNAYHGPKNFLDRLYPSISPVNTFSKLFASLFGERETQLPERHYMPWYDRPYDFVDVTDDLHELDRLRANQNASQ